MNVYLTIFYRSDVNNTDGQNLVALLHHVDVARSAFDVRNAIPELEGVESTK